MCACICVACLRCECVYVVCACMGYVRMCACVRVHLCGVFGVCVCVCGVCECGLCARVCRAGRRDQTREGDAESGPVGTGGGRGRVHRPLGRLPPPSAEPVVPVLVLVSHGRGECVWGGRFQNQRAEPFPYTLPSSVSRPMQKGGCLKGFEVAPVCPGGGGWRPEDPTLPSGAHTWTSSCTRESTV